MNTGWDKNTGWEKPTNAAVAAHLRELASAKTITFKRDAYLNAADVVARQARPVAEMTAKELRALKGIGRSTSAAIVAFCAQPATPATLAGPAKLEHDFSHGGIWCKRCRCRRAIADGRECREPKPFKSLAEFSEHLGAKIESAEKTRQRRRRSLRSYGEYQEMCVDAAMAAREVR